MPLGPIVEFKIIDYGSSYFSETLAEATGGYHSRKNYERLKKMFVAKQLAFRIAQLSMEQGSRKNLVEMDTTAGATDMDGDRSWHLIPSGIKRWFKWMRLPKRMARSGSSDATTLESMSSHMLTSPRRLESFSLDHLPLDVVEEEAQGLRGSESATAELARRHGGTSTTEDPPPQPRQGIIEKLYRKFWRRKGDVFHLLLNLSTVLDNRVWPKEDEQDVNLFLSLVYQVTGVKMKAAFVREDETDAIRLFGCMGRHQRKENKFLYGSKGKKSISARMRKLQIQLKSHLYPFNSGLTAGQALMAPFFETGDGIASAMASQDIAPVPLSNVFPRATKRAST